MGNKLIGAAILFGLFKIAPNQVLKAMVLGAAGSYAAVFVPYVNGKDIAQTINEIKGA